jgi:hypothetical protein
MFDYGYVAMARLDYEERVRKVEHDVAGATSTAGATARLGEPHVV